MFCFKCANKELQTNNNSINYKLFQLQEADKQEAELHKTEKPQTWHSNTNYKDKYEHLIGRVAAKDAAQLTVANRSYGFGKNLISCVFYVFNCYVYVIPLVTLSFVANVSVFKTNVK